MYTIHDLPREDFPSGLLEIPDPPAQLRFSGTLPSHEALFLCVVGSRQYTSYGKEVCRHIISGLRGSGVVIVSGLALGIDAIAHEAALEAGLTTIALPGSGLGPTVLYPKTNVALARKILERGGALLSEFSDETPAAPYTFPQRNRLMAGISAGVLVIEAQERSGTVITARLATEYNKDVFTVPSSIFSKNAEGPHRLLKMGAIPVTCGADILAEWGLSLESNEKNAEEILQKCTSEEHELLSYLIEPCTPDALILKSKMPVVKVTVLLSSLELKGVIKETGGEVRRLI